MAYKSRNGFWSYFGRLSTGLIIFLSVVIVLIILLIRRGGAVNVPFMGFSLGGASNVPSDFNDSMTEIFTASDYSNACKSNWIAIAKMETAAFTSKLYVSYNNPWGMRDASGRINHQSGTIVTGNGVFGTYSGLRDAARDIIDWMNATDFPQGNLSLADHVHEMTTRGYIGQNATQQDEADYLNLVNEWLKK